METYKVSGSYRNTVQQANVTVCNEQDKTVVHTNTLDLRNRQGEDQKKTQTMDINRYLYFTFTTISNAYIYYTQEDKV